jgi:hypothetical protein
MPPRLRVKIRALYSPWNIGSLLRDLKRILHLGKLEASHSRSADTSTQRVRKEGLFSPASAVRTTVSVGKNLVISVYSTIAPEAHTTDNFGLHMVHLEGSYIQNSC